MTQKTAEQRVLKEIGDLEDLFTRSRKIKFATELAMLRKRIEDIFAEAKS